jgi:predicted nucleic acid-binding protein
VTAGLFDSSVLIDCLRGRPDAIAFLAARSAAARPGTHLLVAAELLAGARDKAEQALIDSFLRAFDLAVPDEADGLAALDLYRTFHLSHGVDWPDCQIAATALRLSVDLYTRDVKHFSAFPDLRFVRVY